MTDAQQRKAAKEFAAFWKDKGYEKGLGKDLNKPIKQSDGTLLTPIS